MGIAAGNRCARLGDALLWSHHVDDALFAGTQVEVGHSKVVRIPAQGVHHLGRQRVRRRVLVNGGDDVIHRGKGAVGILHLQSEITDHSEGLGAGHLVDEVGPDEELGAAVAQGAHRVSVPDFLIEGFSHVVPARGGTGNVL